MSVQTKTFSVALDAANQPQPLHLAGVAVGFTTTRWVVVNNLTPYTLLLANVGDAETDQRALAPGTANKYPWTNKNGDLQATWINPITGAPPSTPQVIVEYSDDPLGADLQGSYPTTLASGVSIGSISGAVTLTGPVSVQNVANGLLLTNESVQFLGNLAGNLSGGQLIKSTVLAQNCAGVLVKLQNGAGNNQQVNVIVSNSGNNMSVSGYADTHTGVQEFRYLFFPVPGDTGDTLNVQVLSSGGVAGLMQAWAYAVGGDPGIGAIGVPHQSLDVGGMQYAQVACANNSTAIILAAAPAGMAYRIHSYGLVAGQGAAAYQQRFVALLDGLGTLHADTTVFPTTITTIGANFQLNGQCSAGALTVFQLSSTTSPQTMYVRYDLISIPLSA